MKAWKRMMGLTALFAALALVSYAAEGGAGGRGGMDREAYAKQMKEAATVVAKFVAKEVALAADKTDKFVSAYVVETEAATKRRTESMKGGAGADFRETFMKLSQENQKAMQAMLEANMTGEQAKKALEIIGVGEMERSVASWQTAKLEEAKIAKALPVLAKYSKASMALAQKMGAEAGGEEARAERTKLREATAKELAPIIGEELATKWTASRGFMGTGGRGGGGGRRGGEGGEAPKKQ